MEQPLDLSIPNHHLIKKKTFTIEYLTSDIPRQVQSSLIRTNQSSNPYLNLPLHPMENQLSNNNYQYFSVQTEHVVPNICSPPLPVSSKQDKRLIDLFCFRMEI
jgi:hypothetical protein